MDYYGTVLHRQRRKKARRSQQKGRRRALAGGWLYQPSKATARARRPQKPFIGVDGEGGGTNERGQQNYLLLRAGERVLFNNNKPLSSIDCLEFLLSLPARAIYVGFGFGYDATQILRDMPPAYQSKLFDDQPGYTYWHDYAVDYRPGHYFRVARVRADGRGVIAGTSRTVYETWGFFQSKFTKALDTWGIGDKRARAKMEKTKAERGDFKRISPKILSYNGQECDWLAQLMERFRERSKQCDLVPLTWNGPGKTAAALLNRHNVIRRERVLQLLSPEILDFAQQAYYGGRAELAWIGILEACCAYDIKSAYPAAMLDVPCLEHGKWHQVKPAALAGLTESDLFIADCSYTHPKEQLWCGLPRRATSSGLSWRRISGGIYWSMEIFAARRIGATVKLKRAFLYERRCNCQPLAFVRDVFNQRKALDRIEKGLGLPLKLAINSLYGKFAQRVGEAPWQNPLWAGFITATCRAKVLDAIGSAADQSDIIMVATDGIYSRTPLPLDLGDELGNWEEAETAKNLLFVKPGIYWELSNDPDSLLKVRGMSPKSVRDGKPEVEAAWHDYSRRILNRDDRGPAGERIAPKLYPVVKLPMDGFVGLRLAHARKAPATAGAWTKDLAKLPGADPETNIKRLGFAWGTKRMDWYIIAAQPCAAGLAVLTRPYDGRPGDRSAPWQASETATAQTKDSDMAQFWAEGQPDYLEPECDI